MAELFLDIIIDDEIDVSVVDDEPIDISTIDGEITVVEFPGIRGPRGPSATTHTAVLDAGDGETFVFQLPELAQHPERVQVFRNGLCEVYGIGFTATESFITFTTAPLDSDVISVSYEIKEGS